MSKSSYFWTDRQQASDRLLGSMILYDNQPYWVDDVSAGETDTIPRIIIRHPVTGETTRKKADSPKFARFRELPNLGWINNNHKGGTAFFLTRIPVAGSRIHGLNNSNVRVSSFPFPPGSTFPSIATPAAHFQDVSRNKSFIDAHEDKYPSLEGILNHINEGSAIAYSRKYCVVRDMLGIRWLYRALDCVGLFTGVDTLLLLTRFGYLREEIMADKAFTLNTIREF